MLVADVGNPMILIHWFVVRLACGRELRVKIRREKRRRGSPKRVFFEESTRRNNVESTKSTKIYTMILFGMEETTSPLVKAPMFRQTPSM